MSGDIRHLTQQQWQTIDNGFAFYHRVDSLIASGYVQRQGPDILSYANPVGYQVNEFHDAATLADSRQLLVLVFGFNQARTETIDLDIQTNDWQLADVFGADDMVLDETNGTFRITILAHQFEAKAMLFTARTVHAKTEE